MLDNTRADPLHMSDFDGERLLLRTAAELVARLKVVESLPVRPRTDQLELHRRKAEAVRLRRRLRVLTDRTAEAHVREVYATQSWDFMEQNIRKRSMPELVQYLENLRSRITQAGDGAKVGWETEAARVALEIRRRGMSPGHAVREVKQGAKQYDRKRKRRTREAVRMSRGERDRKRASAKHARKRNRNGGRRGRRSL